MAEERRQFGRRAIDHEPPPWFGRLDARMAALEQRQGTHEDICNERHTDNATLFANAVAQNAAAFAQVGEIRRLIFSAAMSIIAALFGLVLLLARMKGLIG